MGIFSRIFIIILSLVIFNDARAQLCQGSLGDPIVNISFGAGNNPGPALAAATTDYQFYSGDCPNDGSYTVRNNTVDCFGSSWHTLSADHTGDANGYFMLVNASISPSPFYIDTVRALCSNTTFEFAAWVVNVLRASSCGGNGNQPNLTFTIEKTDGTLLQTYNTNNIPQQSSPAWKQYGFFFNTPAGVADIVLRIFNNAPGGCGNDLALDDITFRPCGPQLTTSIDGVTSTEVSFCKGIAKTFTLKATLSPGFNNPSFQWQQSTDAVNWTDITGATNTTFTATLPASTPEGKYLYRLSAAEQGNLNSSKCRVASAALIIDVSPIPVTTISLNSPVCEGATATLTASGGAQYQWTLADGSVSVSNPVSITNAQLTDAGKIYMLATSAVGCTHVDSASLAIIPKPSAAVSFDHFNICSGNNIRLSATGGGSYKWTPSTGLSDDGIAAPVASPAVSRSYLVTVTAANGCTDTASVQVNVVEAPHADAGPDKTIIAGNPVQLSAIVTGQDISYAWSPATGLNNAGILQPLASPTADADYTLTATSNAGCGVDVDQVHIFVFKDLYIPNAFSPDGRGANNTWNVPALNAFPNFELSIYNRRGQLIYQSKNILVPWDGSFKGEPQPAGAYVYVIDVKQPNRPLYKGSLLLIR